MEDQDRDNKGYKEKGKIQGGDRDKWKGQLEEEVEDKVLRVKQEMGED